MAKTLPTINVAADTFGSWVSKVNTALDAISTEVLTANTDANGALVTGNSFLIGIFGANTIVGTILRGGNVQSTNVLTISSNVVVSTGNNISFGNSTVNTVANSLALTLSNSTVSYSFIKPTAVQKATDRYFLNANGSFVDPQVVAIQTTTTGTSAQQIDSYLQASYNSAEYMVTIVDTAANNRQMSKVLVIHSGTAVDYSEYGIVQTNSAMGVFSANANATATRLYFAPTSSATNVTIKAIYSPIP